MGGTGGFLEFCKLFWKSLLLNYFQFSLLHFLLFCSLLLSWIIFLVLLCLSATPRSIFFPQLCYLVSLSSSTPSFLVLLCLSATPSVVVPLFNSQGYSPKVQLPVLLSSLGSFRCSYPILNPIYLFHYFPISELFSIPCFRYFFLSSFICFDFHYSFTFIHSPPPPCVKGGLSNYNNPIH